MKKRTMFRGALWMTWFSLMLTGHPGYAICVSVCLVADALMAFRTRVRT